MDSGIYLILNKTNGHRYVGQSINIRKRWISHRTKTHQHRSVIGRAFRKHGKDAFYFSILERCVPDQLDIRERHHIAIIKPEYNMTPGGAGEGKSMPIEARAVISIKARKQWENMTPEEQRKRIARIQAARRPVSKETRRKMSEANKRFWAGKPRPTSELQKRRASEVNKIGMIGNKRGVRAKEKP